MYVKIVSGFIELSTYSAKRLWENVCYNMTIITVIRSVTSCMVQNESLPIKALTETANNKVNYTTVTQKTGSPCPRP
jgi:hypothetical protein